jgi:hypothetical protein
MQGIDGDFENELVRENVDNYLPVGQNVRKPGQSARKPEVTGVVSLPASSFPK